uniref:Uncharacterized protein n=2 Tax=Emiliania huxleyi TaxID=2903 RepID=A0A6U8RCF5_EMIHU|mmetsp:Transcript_4027/g.12870  ORF Transcript_4027/g.12870 Transcript_4027/m.12870 type:complete len:170 (+) Transcript_4027:412-921(+)
MELAQLKLRHGARFGLPGSEAGGTYASLLSSLAKAGWGCSVADRREALELLDESGARRVEVDSDEAGIAYAAAELSEPRRFVWLPLRELASAEATADQTSRAAALETLRSRLAELIAAAPPNTLVAVVGCGASAGGGATGGADKPSPSATSRPLGCVALTVVSGAAGGA